MYLRIMDKPDTKAPTIMSQHPAFPGKGPARYRIVVGKYLSPTWSDRLAGMEIAPGETDSAQSTLTRLEGVLQDQAQLSGVLNTLYDLGLPLLSVEVLEGESDRAVPRQDSQ